LAQNKSIKSKAIKLKPYLNSMYIEVNYFQKGQMADWK